MGEAFTIPFRAFSGGEVSPVLDGRVDQVKYQTGLRTCRNMFVRKEGPVSNRSGTKFACPLPGFVSDYGRQIPFVFNNEQAYDIVLLDVLMFWVRDGFPLVETAKVITGVTAATPPVVTCVGHGYSDGDLVYIDGVEGMTELNGRFFQAAFIVGPNEFSLTEPTSVVGVGYTPYTSGGTAERVYTVETPWAGADLREIRYKQQNDVMLFAHEDYPVQKLSRLGETSWTLAPAVFAPGIDRPTGGMATGSAGTEDVRYRVTAVSGTTLEESFPGLADVVSVTTVSETAPEATKAVTNVTAANPPVVTCNSHGYNNNDYVEIAMTAGTIEASGTWQVFDVALNTFKLKRNGAAAQGSGWTSGADTGTVRRVHLIEVTTPAHGYSDNDEVTFFDLESPFESLNDRPFIISVTSATTFELKDQYGTTTQSDSPAAATVALSSILAANVIFPDASDPVTITWDLVDGALEYNVYRQINGVYGYIGTAGANTLEDTGLSVNPFDTPPIAEDYFGNAGEFPSAVGFFQQRSAFGGSANDPEGTRVSRIGAFFNMTKSNPIQSDDSFSFGCSGAQVNRVKHYEELDRMCIFTQGAVFTIEGDDAGTLTPTAINPRKRSGSGAGTLQPLVAVSAILYVQYQGNVVQELVPGQPGQATTTKDLTVYSPHLFEEVDIVSWTFAEIPYSIVWAVRDDGTMLGMTYLKEHEIWGWHRHDTGDGDEFVDACSIPEGAESATYLMVRRYTANGARLYIERMPTRLVLDAVDGRFLDSYGEPEELVNEDAGDTYTLNHSGGVWTLAPAGTTALWVAGMASPDIGRVILIYGTDGERLFCRIGSIASTTSAIVTVTHSHPEWVDADGAPNPADTDGPAGAIPFPLTLPYTTNDWSQSSGTIGGLWHLEGRDVMCICDGQAQGPFTVEDGQVTLESHAVIRAAGLAIEADAETLEPDVLDGESLADKTKTVGMTTIRVERTTGLSVGLDADSLQPWNDGWAQDIADDKLFTGKLRVQNMTKSDDQGRVFLRQSLPYPCTISSIYVRLNTGREG
jgi:hypothetical protein